MSLSFTASPFFTPALTRQAQALRAQLEQASQELVTGQKQDVGLALRGDFRALAGIDTALARLAGHATATGEAGLMAGAMQDALGLIDDRASDLASDLALAGTTQGKDQLNAVLATGRSAFETTVGLLNGSVAGRSLFGGVNSSTAPLPDAETILSALGTAVAGATTAEAAQTAIADWFTDPDGFAAHYAGGAARSPVTIAEGETVALDVTALDEGLRETLQGLATIALMDGGLLSGDAAARQALAGSAAETLLSGSTGRQAVAARIGVAEQRIADATTRNAAEKSALTIARTGLIEADPYETSARLQDLETRLDAVYTLVSRLSRLSLTEYL